MESAWRYLDSCNATLAVVSSNSDGNLCRVMGPYVITLSRHFEYAVFTFGKNLKLAQVLKSGGTPGRCAIYIGDQSEVVEVARKAKVACGAASSEYASLESLLAYQPRWAFQSAAEAKTKALV